MTDKYLVACKGDLVYGVRSLADSMVKVYTCVGNEENFCYIAMCFAIVVLFSINSRHRINRLDMVRSREIR